MEVFIGGRWGTVCDDYWGNVDARVVCRQLGLPWTSATAVGQARYGANYGLPIVMDDVGCGGSEASLQACRYTSRHNCVHAEDAGVICSGLTSASSSETFEADSNDQFLDKPSDGGDDGEKEGKEKKEKQNNGNGRGSGRKLLKAL